MVVVSIVCVDWVLGLKSSVFWGFLLSCVLMVFLM